MMIPARESFTRPCFIQTYGRQAVIIFIFIAVIATMITPTAEPAPPDAEICAFLERFHGHTCAGSLMGLRLGLAAKEALKGKGKLKAKCFLLACPVDGIQVSTGATLGNKALEVVDRNKLVLILSDVKTGRQVEARLTKKAVEKGKSFRDFSQKARAYPAGSSEQAHYKKEINTILDWLRTAPDPDVVAVRSLK
jgi:formylmethanofuran dehydrogenase subunit E